MSSGRCRCNKVMVPGDGDTLAVGKVHGDGRVSPGELDPFGR